MENKDEDVKLYLYNQIGDIKDSRINKIEQVLNISPNIPDDLKEAFELYLNLMNEDLLWKKEQRARLQKIEEITRKTELENIKKKILADRTNVWMKVIFLFEITLVILFYLYRIYQKTNVFNVKNYINILWRDFLYLTGNPTVVTSFLLYSIAISILFIFIAAFFSRRIAYRAVHRFERNEKIKNSKIPT